jgi:hypothetical protein
MDREEKNLEFSQAAVEQARACTREGEKGRVQPGIITNTDDNQCGSVLQAK